MAQQSSFARDIRPLARDRDIQSMKFAFDLASSLRRAGIRR